MAMSNCKECGKAVSTRAKTCPNCGAPKPTKKVKKVSKKVKDLNYKIDEFGLKTSKNKEGKKDWVHVGSGDYVHKPNRLSPDKFFDGDLDLATAFWIYGGLVSIIIGVVCGALNEIVHPIFDLPYIVAQAVIIVCLWNCADFHKKKKIAKDESAIWGILTQVYCVLAGLGLVGFVISLFK